MRTFTCSQCQTVHETARGAIHCCQKKEQTRFRQIAREASQFRSDLPRVGRGSLILLPEIQIPLGKIERPLWVHTTFTGVGSQQYCILYYVVCRIEEGFSRTGQDWETTLYLKSLACQDEKMRRVLAVNGKSDLLVQCTKTENVELVRECLNIMRVYSYEMAGGI